MEQENNSKLNSVYDRLANLEIDKAEKDIIIENLKEDIKSAKDDQQAIEKAIEPLKQHMIVSSALIKAVSVLGALIGVILGIVQIISKVR